MGEEVYDIIIVGGGSAGLTAGIYVRRAGLKALLLEKSYTLGGQAALAGAIENYPGFPEISGADLAKKFEEQTVKHGLEVKKEEVTEIRVEGEKRVVKTPNGEYTAKAIVVASGAKSRRLGIEGEEELIGKGISFCAWCDGAFFAGKDVLVLGGGDSGVKGAIDLAKIANRVYLVHRRDKLRAEKIWQERVLTNKKIEVIWNSTVEKIIGKEKVEGLIVKNLKTNKSKEIKADGLFIYIGHVPNTDFIEVKKDKAGYIITDENMETSTKGIFAAGDCRSSQWRQISTSVGEGAMAAIVAMRYIAALK